MASKGIFNLRDKDFGWAELGRFLINNSSRHVDVGIFQSTAQRPEKGPDNLMIGYTHEFGRGKTIPERSFIRATIDLNYPAYYAILKKIAFNSLLRRSVVFRRQGMRALGAKIQSDIRGRIKSGIMPPNSWKTIQRKNRSTRKRRQSVAITNLKTTPLIDTGLMVKSITYKVGP